MIKKITASIATGLVFLLSSCGDNSDSQVKESITEYLKSFGPSIDFPSSMGVSVSFPVEIYANDFNVKKYDGMYELGLLSREDVKLKPSGLAGISKKGEKVDGFRYDLTEKGKSMVITRPSKWSGESKHFRVGDYELLEVNDKTDPAEVMGNTVMEVGYTYKSINIDSEVINSGLLRKNEVGEQLKRKDTFIKTDKGWVHEKLWSE